MPLPSGGHDRSPGLGGRWASGRWRILTAQLDLPAEAALEMAMIADAADTIARCLAAEGVAKLEPISPIRPVLSKSGRLFRLDARCWSQHQLFGLATKVADLGCRLSTDALTIVIKQIKAGSI